MGYIIFILLLVFFVVVGVILAQNKDKIPRKTKIVLGLCLLLIALLIGIYNILQEKESEEFSRLKSAFMHNKILTCAFQSRTLTISAEHFILSNGTMSFQGKSNTPYNGIIIPLQDCKINDIDDADKDSIQKATQDKNKDDTLADMPSAKP
ncbi:hypothetical protein LS66_008145 [Helicobacter sp. MIT 03-1614]|uniref:hypothetical protein n=1 Tax=Helicobacter sp. MIT 03-1614 TaxID=1548147 RepID=UPI000512DA32|nr:hypothetical protein [Helicobacter sp. MIT 03-1614]TLD87478.1 hypothetical protein LS66_008145 [Helicobacter sp. MIT 03-1614]